MLNQKAYLSEVLFDRIRRVDPSARKVIDQAQEIVVFGSMAASLDRPDSDIDVLCFGDREFKLKNHFLDLIVLPRDSTSSRRWLGSELAVHVGRYGVCIQGEAAWLAKVRIGEEAVREKRRRVQAFMRCLPGSWFRLEEDFRIKYSVKVRREAQRFLLMGRGEPVPPTRMLDQHWQTLSSSDDELMSFLDRMIPRGSQRFSQDFLTHVSANLSRSAQFGDNAVRCA